MYWCLDKIWLDLLLTLELWETFDLVTRMFASKVTMNSCVTRVSRINKRTSWQELEIHGLVLSSYKEIWEPLTAETFYKQTIMEEHEILWSTEKRIVLDAIAAVVYKVVKDCYIMQLLPFWSHCDIKDILLLLLLQY